MPCTRQGRVVRTDPQSHIHHSIMGDLRHDAEPVSPKQFALIARSVTVKIDVQNPLTGSLERMANKADDHRLA